MLYLKFGFRDKIVIVINQIKNISAKTFFYDVKYIFALLFTIDFRLSYVIIMSFQIITLGMTGNIKKSLTLPIIIWTVIATINRFVMQSRGVPFAASDILSIGTAITVFNGYKLKISIVFTISICLVFYTIIVIVMKKTEKINNICLRVILFILGIIMLIKACNTLYFKNINLWELLNCYEKHGEVVTFIKTFDNVHLEKPEDYSKEIAEEILEQNDSKESKINEDLPNIIVIMNESFSDIKGTYNLEIEDNMPFFHSLKDNTIKGDLYVSVLGGGTATTEWEFLTGNSAAFIPKNAIPYVGYINEEKESFITCINKLNYETIGFHSYYKSGYRRNIAYKYLGFKKAFFIDSMTKKDTIALDRPTDLSTYENYFEFIDSKKLNFGFIVTMQNHSPYSYDEKKMKMYTNNEECDKYLNLINESDNALEKLINKLKMCDKKTVVLFFGDHQPGFVSEYDMFKTDEWMQNYKVPFFIWANYDIESKENIKISSNYLSCLLADVVNIPKSEYMQYLEELREEIPIITAGGYMDDTGKIYDITDENSPKYKKIKEYNIVQYYQMFDK